MAIPLVISALLAGGVLVPHAAGGLIVSSAAAGGYVAGTYLSTAAVTGIITTVGATAIASAGAITTVASRMLAKTALTSAAATTGVTATGTTAVATGISTTATTTALVSLAPTLLTLTAGLTALGLGYRAYEFYELKRKIANTPKGQEVIFTDKEAKFVEDAVKLLGKDNSLDQPLNKRIKDKLLYAKRKIKEMRNNIIAKQPNKIVEMETASKVFDNLSSAQLRELEELEKAHQEGFYSDADFENRVSELMNMGNK
jgi:hypothetical protein